MSKAILCMVNSQDHAELIVNHLRDNGFNPDAISLLIPDHKGEMDFNLRHGSKVPEGATTGMTTGGLIGAGLGWVAALGAVTIPGIGPLLAAGPIFAALSGAAVGAAVGGLAGSLVGLGIPEFEAKLYEGKLKAGGILIAVNCHSQDEEHRAKDIVRDGGAHDITSANTIRPKGKKKEKAKP